VRMAPHRLLVDGAPPGAERPGAVLQPRLC
jgi:hypothetical protein